MVHYDYEFGDLVEMLDTGEYGIVIEQDYKEHYILPCYKVCFSRGNAEYLRSSDLWMISPAQKGDSESE